MLDFAFGQFGYGLGAGMRSEQDRITQNRTQFANNMATFLANNPYISPEAAQAYINAAAGTDNTLRGSVPNQLIGEINAENARRRRIDNFKAFNEFMRLNPGATPAEFQSAMSSLGAQGVYGEDALKAIMGRADQYRRDQETARTYENAQRIGQMRGQLTADAKSIFIRNGFNVEATRKELERIYGPNTPVPLDTIVNPGMASSLQSELMREYLPKAVDILGRNPNMTPEMLYGIWPELQGSPLIKGIYDAAQTERKKAVQDKFYGNKKQIVDAVASSILLGSDPQKALTEAIRGTGIAEADLGSLDSSTILSEAKALAEKSKADEQMKLDSALAGAKGKMFGEIRTNTLADPTTLQALATGDISTVESFIRARIRDESGLTQDQLAKIPDSYYASLAQTIQQQLVTKAKMDQAKVYDDVYAQQPGILKSLRDQNKEIAKQYDSDSVQAFIKNSGLADTPSGAAIPTLMSTFAETYDLSQGGAASLFSALVDAAKANPEAGMAIGTAAIKSAGLSPLASKVNDQVEGLAWEKGAVSRTPIPSTTFVNAEKAKITKSVEAQIAAIQSKISLKGADPEQLLADLQKFRDRVVAQSGQTAAHYARPLQTAETWSIPTDRFTQQKMAEIVNHSDEETARLVGVINEAMQTVSASLTKQKTQSSAPGEILRSPTSPDRSRAYNTLIAPLAVTPERAQIALMREKILRNLPTDPGLIGWAFGSENDHALANKLMTITQSPEMLTVLYKEPQLWALIDPESDTRNPARLIQELQARGFFGQPPAPQQ